MLVGCSLLVAGTIVAPALVRALLKSKVFRSRYRKYLTFDTDLKATVECLGWQIWNGSVQNLPRALKNKLYSQKKGSGPMSNFLWFYIRDLHAKKDFDLPSVTIFQLRLSICMLCRHHLSWKIVTLDNTAWNVWFTPWVILNLPLRKVKFPHWVNLNLLSSLIIPVSTGVMMLEWILA
jgi:hypothetical protein